MGGLEMGRLKDEKEAVRAGRNVNRGQHVVASRSRKRCGRTMVEGGMLKRRGKTGRRE